MTIRKATGILFFILDIKYRFIRDESKFFQYVAKFQNIMPRIVVNLLLNQKFAFQQVHLKRTLFGSLDLFNIQFYEKTLAKSAVLLPVEIPSFFCKDELHKIFKFNTNVAQISQQKLSKKIGLFQTEKLSWVEKNKLLLTPVSWSFVSFQSFFFF